LLYHPVNVTDRLIKELRESQKETDRIVKETSKQIGTMNNRFGEIVEYIVKKVPGISNCVKMTHTVSK